MPRPSRFPQGPFTLFIRIPRLFRRHVQWLSPLEMSAALPNDLWQKIYTYSAKEAMLPSRAWRGVESYIGPRTPQEELTRRSLKRRSCSPCNVLLKEDALTEDDQPYDSAVCDHTCHGQWSVALGRLAENVIQAAGHYGYPREVTFRLQLESEEYLLTYFAHRGEDCQVSLYALQFAGRY